MRRRLFSRGSRLGLRCLILVCTSCSGLVLGSLVFGCLTFGSFVLSGLVFGSLVLGSFVFFSFVFGRLILGSFVLGASFLGCYDTLAGKLARLGCRRNGRLPMVHGRQEFMVGAGGPYMFGLQRRWRCVLLTRRSFFLRGGASVESASAAVIADVVDGSVVDDGLVVNVGDVGAAKVIHRAVVAEGAVIPVSALIADTTIAEAIVNATVEANARAPVTAIPGEGAAAPTPIS